MTLTLKSWVELDVPPMGTMRDGNIHIDIDVRKDIDELVELHSHHVGVYYLFLDDDWNLVELLKSDEDDECIYECFMPEYGCTVCLYKGRVEDDWKML